MLSPDTVCTCVVFHFWGQRGLYTLLHLKKKKKKTHKLEGLFHCLERKAQKEKQITSMGNWKIKCAEKQGEFLRSLLSMVIPHPLSRNLRLREAQSEERGRRVLELKRKTPRGRREPGCTWSGGQSSVGSRAGVNRLNWAQEARYTESRQDKSRCELWLLNTEQGKAREIHKL